MGYKKEYCEDKIEIVQGENRELTIAILNEQGEIKDLTGNTGIQSVHPKDDGTYLIKSTSDVVDPITIISGTNKIKIVLNPTDTADLKPIKNTTMYVAVDFPAPLDRRVFKIKDAYDVCEAEFTLP